MVRLPSYEATKRFTAETEDTKSMLDRKRRGLTEDNMLPGENEMLE